MVHTTGFLGEVSVYHSALCSDSSNVHCSFNVMPYTHTMCYTYMYVYNVLVCNSYWREDEYMPLCGVTSMYLYMYM